MPASSSGTGLSIGPIWPKFWLIWVVMLLMVLKLSRIRCWIALLCWASVGPCSSVNAGISGICGTASSTRLEITLLSKPCSLRILVSESSFFSSSRLEMPSRVLRSAPPGWFWFLFGRWTFCYCAWLLRRLDCLWFCVYLEPRWPDTTSWEPLSFFSSSIWFLEADLCLLLCSRSRCSARAWAAFTADPAAELAVVEKPGSGCSEACEARPEAYLGSCSPFLARLLGTGSLAGFCAMSSSISRTLLSFWSRLALMFFKKSSFCCSCCWCRLANWL